MGPTRRGPWPRPILTKGPRMPQLFEPLTLRDVEFRNRIWLTPMCQYSCEA